MFHHYSRSFQTIYKLCRSLNMSLVVVTATSKGVLKAYRAQENPNKFNQRGCTKSLHSTSNLQQCNR